MRFLQTAMMVAAAMTSTATMAQTTADDYFVLNPEPGVIEAFNNYFTLRGSDNVTIENGVADHSVITLSCPDNSVIDMQTARIGTVIRIAFPTSVDIPSAPGDYVLHIPADRFSVGGTGNAESAYMYTIEEKTPDSPDTPDNPAAVDPYQAIHITPAEGKVTSLSEWNVTFDCEWGLENRSAKFSLTGPEGVAIPALRSGSTGTSYYINLADNAVLTAPGTYVFTIPEGKFSLGDARSSVLNPAMSFTYVIDGEASSFPEYSIDPAPGSYKSIDNGFSLAFNSGEIAVNASAVTLLGPEDVLEVDVAVDGNRVLVSPTKGKLTQEGAYTLNFGAGAITVNGISNGKAIRFSYFLTSATGEIWNGTFTAVPAEGSEVENLQYIDIAFDGARKVKVSDYAGPNDFPTLYNEAGSQVCRAAAFAEGAVLQLSLTSKVTTPGAYRIVVPSSFILIDNATPANDIEIAYTIAGSGIGECVPVLNPAPGSKLHLTQEIEITFDSEDIVSVTNNPFAWGHDAPYFSSADGYFCPSLQITGMDKSFALSHQYPFEEEGVYTLTIPAGYFTAELTDGSTSANATVVAEYWVVNKNSGIDAVDADDADPELYTSTGIRTGFRLSQLQSLPAGIYIAAGRKVCR